MTVWLRSAAFNLVFIVVSTLAAVAMLPALAMPRRVMVRLGRLWARLVLRLFAALVGATSEVRGRAHLPAAACIIAAKHQSAWETIALAALFADPCFVIKRELALFPVLGWILVKQGHLFVERGAGPRALKRLVAKAARVKGSGRPIIIFPEGTRVAPGESRPYQPGVAALYRYLALPVVPLALNSGLAWGRRRFVKRPRHIVVEVLEPIPPGLARAAFMDRLRTAIDGATRALEAEAGVSRTPSRSAAA